MTVYGVYGASGFGREIMPLLQQQVKDESEVECVFVDDSPHKNRVNGYRCVSFLQFMELPARGRAITLAVADCYTRRRLGERCEEAGVPMIDVRATYSVVMNETSIGGGLVLCDFTTITSNVTIGRCFHANIYSYVGHDCVIGDFVTFAPGVKCNGNVHIGDNVYIGTGAMIRQGKPDRPLVIGSGAIVGMGAVVTRDVPPGVTVIGNPARPLIKS